MATYYIAGFPISDELYHHGIKGQRWGVRRYQNEDGTLTAAGKARYGSDLGETVKSVKNKVSEKYQSGKASVMSKAKSIDREKLKKAVIIGASVVGAAALAYGGYKLAEANPEMIQYGKYKVKSLLNRNKNNQSLSNLTESWKDHPEDDAINRMAKSGFRDIENRYGKTSSNMSEVISKGTNEAFSKMRDEALQRSNANYADRAKSSEADIKREQELGRERRQILKNQMEETYKILKEEQKQERKNRKNNKAS